MKGSIGFLMLGITGLFSVMASMMGGFVNFNHSASVAPSNYYAMMSGFSNTSSQNLAAQCAGMMSDYGVNLSQSQINYMTGMMHNEGYGMMRGYR